jgi:hypothetical protein
LTQELEQDFLDADLSENENDSDADADSSEKQKSKSTRPRKLPAYSFVKNLNLRPEGKASLRTFYEEKKPTDNQQLLTVVVYYLYRTLEIKGISVNHVYTSLKELTDQGVRVPPDIPNVLRKISNRKGWLDTSNADDLKTTVQGDNFVEHDLPKGKSPDVPE